MDDNNDEDEDEDEGVVDEEGMVLVSATPQKMDNARTSKGGKRVKTESAISEYVLFYPEILIQLFTFSILREDTPNAAQTGRRVTRGRQVKDDDSTAELTEQESEVANTKSKRSSKVMERKSKVVTIKGTKDEGYVCCLCRAIA